MSGDLKVINFLGGPCSGKSTTAAGLFYEMKKQGKNVELVTEYAKDLVYEGTLELMLDRQEMVFAEQNQRLHRLRGKVDYAITDGPLLLSLVYPRMNQRQKGLQPWPALNAFENFVIEVMKTFDNVYVFLNRPNTFDERGREHTEDQSREIDREIISALVTCYTEYYTFDVHDNVVLDIMNNVKELNTP